MLTEHAQTENNVSSSSKYVFPARRGSLSVTSCLPNHILRNLCCLFFFKTKKGNRLLLVFKLRSSLCHRPNYRVLRSQLRSSITLAAIPSSRYIMIMLTLICCYYSLWVSCSSLNMFTDIAPITGALIVAPAITNVSDFSDKKTKSY